MKAKVCYSCHQKVERDIIALNQKMVGRESKRFLCLMCLAEYLGCTEEELSQKIQEFKEQGCGLFF